MFPFSILHLNNTNSFDHKIEKKIYYCNHLSNARPISSIENVHRLKKKKQENLKDVPKTTEENATQRKANE